VVVDIWQFFANRLRVVDSVEVKLALFHCAIRAVLTATSIAINTGLAQFDWKI